MSINFDHLLSLDIRIFISFMSMYLNKNFVFLQN